MLLKLRGRQPKCKVANKYLNIREQVKRVERNKDSPSLPLQSIDLPVSVIENPNGKKITKKKIKSEKIMMQLKIKLHKSLLIK